MGKYLEVGDRWGGDVPRPLVPFYGAYRAVRSRLYRWRVRRFG